jgi:hypothetical protein
VRTIPSGSFPLVGLLRPRCLGVGDAEDGDELVGDEFFVHGAVLDRGQVSVDGLAGLGDLVVDGGEFGVPVGRSITTASTEWGVAASAASLRLYWAARRTGAQPRRIPGSSCPAVSSG